MLAGLDGQSLLRPIDPERLIIVHNGVTNVRVLQGFALVRGSLRLLFHPVGDVGKVELYDLAKDPLERKSVLNDPAYASEVGRLRKLMIERLTVTDGR